MQLMLLMCAAEIFSMTGFAAYTTLLPALQREWALSNSEAGLVSGIYYAGYVMATPVSWFVGFSFAMLSPLVFGAVLDLAGGNRSVLAWGLAFASIGLFGGLAPVARRIYLRRG